MSAMCLFSGLFAGVRELRPVRVIAALTPSMTRDRPAMQAYESFTSAMQRR
ncbi:hypothetical protein LF41_1768 [Lysobacter dokdonensis DS-58]|uniref:Uncharacterized protein n=1 Tax=Lysobacter dokdonensis DS-58 TaxID=1300345 RepID=A0A0A2WXZ7_9GAMM|nr:hypothetical protein LF41_1768 [Lysobacter dokdonensis DS-58]